MSNQKTKKSASPLKLCSKQATFFVLAASFFQQSISNAEFEWNFTAAQKWLCSSFKMQFDRVVIDGGLYADLNDWQNSLKCIDSTIKNGILHPQNSFPN